MISQVFVRSTILVALLFAITGVSAAVQGQSVRTADSASSPATADQTHFVRVRGTDFMVGGEPYHYLGVNLWYAMNLGAPIESGDRDRLGRELDHLDSLGITNLRIMAGTEGPASEPWRVTPALQPAPGTFNEDLLRGLDFVLAEAEKRDMRVVLCLNNFFQWSGGMAQYVSWATGTEIPYPHEEEHSWREFQEYSARFFRNEQAQEPFFELIYTLIHRENTITGERYREDPTIMAWQLANEPRGFSKTAHYVRWVDRTAGVIQALDGNHLVSLGGEGRLFPRNRTQFERVSRSPHLDYLTAHLWLENWGWYDPTAPDSTFATGVGRMMGYVANHTSIAREIGKPLVFEEFGVGRDGGQYDPDAPVTYRNEFYRMLFETMHKIVKEGGAVAGGNVWSWSGEALPREPGAFWEPGDPFTGDPPHERQGWYGIYDSDTTTLSLLRRYARRMGAIGSRSDSSIDVARIVPAALEPVGVLDLGVLLSLAQLTERTPPRRLRPVSDR